MTAPDLKPCPLCGGKCYLANADMAGCAYVVCTDCRLQSDDGSQERVTAAWNTRAPAEALAVPEAYEKGLRDALGLIASIGYGKNEDVDEGHEEAFRAIEKHLTEWKAAAKGGAA